MSSCEKVSTNCGPVSGNAHTTTREGKKYSAFLGIPYAKQPTDGFRFRDPQPLEPWTDDGPCTSIDNCLNLNIYSPNVNAKLPVYVWIHGGGIENSLDCPDFFIESDIVVVTVNSRAGVVGFLSFKEKSLKIPGNAGLKDQCMALRWIKENVARFGGDPNNITLGGQGTDAASVHYHMISPMSAGLFNRAILQSGSAFNPWASMPDRERYEYELARKLGWDGKGGDRGAFAAISKVTTECLVQVAQKLVGQSHEKRIFGSALFTPFSPRVEPYGSESCFLPKSLVELGREAWSRDIDIIVGGTKDEGLIFESLYNECRPVLEKNFKLLIPNHLRQTLRETEQAAAASILKNCYFWRCETNLKVIEKFVEIMGDLTFWHGIHRLLLQRAFKGGTGKTFHYFLATSLLASTQIRKKFNVEDEKGTCHGDDLMLIWQNHSQLKPTFKQFQSMYKSFIATGDPNNPDLEIEWKTIMEKPTTEDRFTCMEFYDDGVDLIAAPYGERLLIWDMIYDTNELI